MDGQDWKEFDRQKEWIQISNPAHERYTVVANY
jgi:hypothetical protein